MVDWNKPTAASIYDPDFLNEVKDRDHYAGTMGLTDPANKPVGLMKFNRATGGFEEWDGAAWVSKPISVISGGALGTMAFQNANAVAITGGTISGITALGLSGNVTVSADDAWKLGTDAARLKGAYFRSFLVLPSGVDKYATS